MSAGDGEDAEIAREFVFKMATKYLELGQPLPELAWSMIAYGATAMGEHYVGPDRVARLLREFADHLERQEGQPFDPHLTLQ